MSKPNQTLTAMQQAEPLHDAAATGGTALTTAPTTVGLEQKHCADLQMGLV
jgi:hypothetical protein